MNTKLKIAKLIGTSFGCGYARFAPGTVGAIFGALCYLMLVYGFVGFEAQAKSLILNLVLIVLIGVFTWLGTWSARLLEPVWGHDPGKIVMDETIGIWITLLFIPFSWTNTLIALILFRFFDILKPMGIKAIDRKMHSPFSVMLDDILAGVYSAVSLQAIIYFFET